MIKGSTVLLQVLARARERGDGEECGLEEEDSGDSSEEEDIVTEFPISNGGNSSLAEVFPSILIECLVFWRLVVVRDFMWCEGAGSGGQ